MGSNNTHIHTLAGLGRRLRSLGVLTVAGALALTACGGDDDTAASDDMAAADAAEAPAANATAEGDMVRSGETAAEEVAGDADSAGVDSGDAGFEFGAIGRDVIIEMRVVLSSDDIKRSVASITANASSLGGGIASSDVDYGDAASPDSGYAILVVKVPPTAVDRLLSGLDDAGTVQSINQSARDVTEQLVDLGVRIANARQSVANVREFMDRTENLAELVTLEGELTRRQTELERLEAQQRNITDRVALSTITIEVVPTASVPDLVVDEPDTINDAFERGWDVFASVVFAIAYVLAVTLPFLLIGAVVAAAAWLIARRRSSNAEAVPGGDPRPPSDSPDAPGPAGTPDPGADDSISEDASAIPVG